MKVTPDRLAVARAALCWVQRDESEDDEAISAVIESLPEPPDDSPATLPAPDVQAQIDDGHLPLGMCITSIAKIREDLVAARAEEREAIIDAIGGLDGPADYRRAMFDVLRIIAARRRRARGVRC